MAHIVQDKLDNCLRISILVLFNQMVCLLKKKALSLVEVVLAIGISAIALTTSAVFTTRLVARSQKNFMSDSAMQLTNLIVEQLRLVEIDLQTTKSRIVLGGDPNSYPPTLASRDVWNTICRVVPTGSASNPVYLSTQLPTFTSGSNNAPPLNINLSISSSGTPRNTPWGDFRFDPVPPANRMGAFAIDTNSDLGLSIQLTAERNNLLGADILVFTVLISYRVPNISEIQYSTPVIVKMVKSTVCV